MMYLKPLVSLALLLALLSCAVAFAQSNDPYTNPYEVRSAHTPMAPHAH